MSNYYLRLDTLDSKLLKRVLRAIEQEQEIPLYGGDLPVLGAILQRLEILDSQLHALDLTEVYFRDHPHDHQPPTMNFVLDEDKSQP